MTDPFDSSAGTEAGIPAIVLAAGRATRFGRCKQLFPLRGKPLLAHVLDTLHASRIGEILVVLGHDAAEIQDALPFSRERVVINEHYAEGMSTSLHAGLRALSPDAGEVLIVLADQPFVRPETVNLLLNAAATAQEAAVAPTWNGRRGNPVLVRRVLFDAMFALDGDTGFRAILRDVPVASVPVEDRGVVLDIDTAGDVDAADG